MKESIEPLLGSLIVRSSSHDVWSDDEGAIYKLPNAWFKWLWSRWQPMTEAATREDLRILGRYGLPHIPTGLADPGAEDRFLIGRKTPYMMVQPDARPCKPLVYDDLLQSPESCAALRQMLAIALKIVQKENKGADLLGAATIPEGGLVLLPFFGHVRAAMRNILVSEKPIGGHEPGTPLLCDTRLLDFEGSERSPMIRLLRFTTLVQYLVLAKLMEWEEVHEFFDFPPKVQWWASVIAARAKVKLRVK